MPKYRRSRSNRRYKPYSKKKYLKKYRKVQFKRMMITNPAYYKSRAIVPLTTSTGSLGVNVGCFTLAFNFNGVPGATNSTSCIVAGDPLGLGGFAFQGMTSLDDVWSVVRCAAVQIKYVPQRPNDAATTATFRPCYLAYDRDGHEEDMSAQLSEEAMLRNSRLKVKNLYRPWKVFIKAPHYRINSKYPSVYNAAGQANANIAGQWHNFGTSLCGTTSQQGQHVLINCYSETPTTTYGSFIITGYFVMKDRLE